MRIFGLSTFSVISNQRTAIAILVAIWTTTAFADETQWAGYRGAGVDGVASTGRPFSDFGELGLKATWKTRIGSGYSGVAVADGRVVTMYADGGSDVIAAFDIADGRKLWSHAFADTYTGHDGSHDGPITTPLIVGGRVFGLGPLGQFFAVDAATGKELWSTHLLDDHEIKKPHYGYGTSPVFVDGVLLLELGGESALAAFDPASGEKLWGTGSDVIGYQVPVPMTLGGRRQIVGAGETKLFGVDATNGKLLWEWEHGGSGGPGAHSMTPVPAGDDRIFLSHLRDSSTLVAFKGNDGKASFETVWEERSIRNSYNVPVYHDGHVYAFSSRFLTCVDAATGESKWRSREPGDGFLIAAGGNLVIATKNGGVHVAEATPEGYRELAALPVFEDLTWSAPSFAGGSIYVRSLGELARLDLAAGGLGTRVEVASRGVSRSAFGRFLAEVDAAAEGAKSAVVDRYLTAQKSFPIIEGESLVHFVYRGPATDVAVAGDVFGTRREQTMSKVPGTDLFYHSVDLESDARVNYLLLEDYEEILDPRNPRETETTMVGKDMEMSMTGEAMPMSWLAMPDWREPAHLAPAPESRRGRLETHEMVSETLKDAPAGPPGSPPADPKVTLEVYLPHGYDESEARYPVAFVHDGKAAIERGLLPNSLDNLIGERVAPVIVVFLGIPAQGPRYDQVFVEEVVPFGDQSFRTQASPAARANPGSNFAGLNAMLATLKHPDLFHKIATQSLILLTFSENMIYPLVEEMGEEPPAIYMDWGKYDMRTRHENWDTRVSNHKLAQALRDKGVDVAGGEASDGTGWSSWRNRTDRVFEAMFPLR